MFQILNEQHNAQFIQNDKMILLTFDDNYVEQTINLIMSILAYNSGCMFICLCSKLTKENTDKLLQTDAGIKIITLTIDSTIDTKNWPVTTIFRVFAPWILDNSISNILYMDSDFVCTGDISKLLYFVPGYIAMCPEINASVKQNMLGYFFSKHPLSLYCNAGVAKLNCDTIRRDYSFQQVLDAFFESIQYTHYVDQDFLNIFFGKKIDIINNFLYNFQAYELLGSPMYDKVIKSCSLIHFTIGKPWNYKTPRQLIKLYYKHTRYDAMKKRMRMIIYKNLIYSTLRFPKKLAVRLYKNIRFIVFKRTDD